MKGLFQYLFIPGIFLILLSSIIHPQNLTLKLCLEKNVYLTGEPVYALAELSNNSSPIKVQPLQLVSCMDLIFMDSTKTVLCKVAAWIGFGYKEGGVDFNRGDTITGFCFVSQSVSNMKKQGISVYESGSIKPGKYYLQFKYEYSNPIRKGEKKDFLSDIVEFRVIEPESQADKIVYETLTRKDIKEIAGKPYKERKKYGYLLLDLVKKYPESGYFPSAYYNFFFALEKESYDLILIDSIIEESFVKYPNAFINLFLIEAYMNLRPEIFTSKKLYGKLSPKMRMRLKGSRFYSDIWEKEENRLMNE